MNVIWILRTAGLSATVFLLLGSAACAGETVTWSAFTGGWGTALSSGTTCTGVAGQALAGDASNSQISLTAGFFGNGGVKPAVVTEVMPGTADRGRAVWLEQNFPNPCHFSTAIRFNLPRPAHVNLKLYSVAGQVQLTLVDDDRQAGLHQMNLNTVRIRPGVYFYRLETVELGDPLARAVGIRKLVVLK